MQTPQFSLSLLFFFKLNLQSSQGTWAILSSKQSGFFCGLLLFLLSSTWSTGNTGHMGAGVPDTQDTYLLLATECAVPAVEVLSHSRLPLLHGGLNQSPKELPPTETDEHWPRKTVHHKHCESVLHINTIQFLHCLSSSSILTLSMFPKWGLSKKKVFSSPTLSLKLGQYVSALKAPTCVMKASPSTARKLLSLDISEPDLSSDLCMSSPTFFCLVIHP